MDHLEERLPGRLDENGDLPPPWSTVPTYGRYTLGWRMGGGEEVMLLFHLFLKGWGLTWKPVWPISSATRPPPIPGRTGSMG